jgi:hypothetical protein
MAQDSVAQDGMAQDGVAAEASIAPPDNKKETDPDAIAQASRQEPRVRLGEGYACGDPATQIVPVADFRDAVHARLIDADTPGYRPLAVVERRSTADYPARLLQSNTPGAVGILLFVEPDGSVSKILSVCATDPAFVPFAEQVVAANRYRASTVAGKPVPDVAYQIVAYGVAED